MNGQQSLHNFSLPLRIYVTFFGHKPPLTKRNAFTNTRVNEGHVLADEWRIIVLDNWDKLAPYPDDLCVGCNRRYLVVKYFCTVIKTEGYESGRRMGRYVAGLCFSPSFLTL